MPFLLTREPWIPCRTLDGTLVELGIIDVFERAHELDCITDPSPLVTLALHRFLLAILHRVFGPADLAEWASLWHNGVFDARRLSGYLDEWARRFDLLDPERPFFQTRGLPDIYEPDGVERLVFERSNYGAASALFEHPTASSDPTLSLSEAARGLLALHAFAPGGLVKKAGEPGSATAAPLNRGAYVLLRGENLFETLLRNLLVYAPREDRPIPSDHVGDLPSWEQSPLARPTSDREPRRAPRGWIDRLTWQSRRVELILDASGSRVRGILYCVGQGLETDVLDPMLAVRQDAKRGRYAVEFSDERATWRDAHALVRTAHADGARPTLAVTQARSPEVRSVMGLLPLQLDLLGMKGDQALIRFARAEHISFTRAIFEREEAIESVEEAIALAENASQAVRSAVFTAARSALAPGGRSPDAGDVRQIADSLGVERRYWAALATPFGEFLDAAGRGDESALADFFASVREAAIASLGGATRSLGTASRHLQAEARADLALRTSLNKLRHDAFGDRP